jgi:hypothetical protein
MEAAIALAKGGFEVPLKIFTKQIYPSVQPKSKTPPSRWLQLRNAAGLYQSPLPAQANFGVSILGVAISVDPEQKLRRLASTGRNGSNFAHGGSAAKTCNWRLFRAYLSMVWLVEYLIHGASRLLMNIRVAVGPQAENPKRPGNGLRKAFL